MTLERPFSPLHARHTQARFSGVSPFLFHKYIYIYIYIYIEREGGEFCSGKKEFQIIV